jgi:hypothetical protein
MSNKTAEIFTGNKTFTIILGVLSILLLIIGGFYLYVVNSPQYAFYKLSEANSNKDLEEFKKYADIESSVNHLSQKNVEVMREELDTQDESGQEFIEGLIFNSFESETAKDSFVYQIESEVNEGKFLEKEFSLLEAFSSGQVDDNEFRVKIDKYSGEDASEVWLVFTKEDEGWKVTKFDLDWEKVRQDYRTDDNWRSYRKND